MSSSAELAAYYARRAPEYERIYARQERQPDLHRLRAWLAGALAGHDVLEVACGTGYWTEAFAGTARATRATDANEEVLAIARAKAWGAARVEFAVADAYALPPASPPYSAAFAGFWWSHVPRRRLETFLTGLHARLAPGALVIFMDNRYVEGSSHPIMRTDADGNTYQLRRLDDGSTHEVLKNFPSEADLLAAVANFGREPEVAWTNYFWTLRYRVG